MNKLKRKEKRNIIISEISKYDLGNQDITIAYLNSLYDEFGNSCFFVALSTGYYDVALNLLKP